MKGPHFFPTPLAAVLRAKTMLHQVRLPGKPHSSELAASIKSEPIKTKCYQKILKHAATAFLLSASWLPGGRTAASLRESFLLPWPCSQRYITFSSSNEREQCDQGHTKSKLAAFQANNDGLIQEKALSSSLPPLPRKITAAPQERSLKIDLVATDHETPQIYSDGNCFPPRWINP